MRDGDWRKAGFCAVTWRGAVLSSLSPSGRRARLLILTFHQVPGEPDTLLSGVASKEAFELQMTWLSEFCQVLSLSDAGRRLRAGTLPARAACITFDDGYRDNCEVAAPILNRLGLPATFFITSGAIERGIMWNDLVIEGIRRAQSDLDLQDIDLGQVSISGTETRRDAFRRLIERIKYQPLEERMSIAETVYSKATQEPEPRLMMSKEQVRELSASGFEIGGHTVSHPILEKLSDDQAKFEIENNRRWIVDVTGVNPTSFAYPNGRFGNDFSSRHERLVDEAGYEFAVSTDWGAASRLSRDRALPRFAPWERDRHGFWLRLLKTLLRSYPAR